MSRRDIQLLLDRLGIELVSIRQNKHRVLFCRHEGKEFQVVCSVTPRNGARSMQYLERDLLRKIGRRP